MGCVTWCATAWHSVPCLMTCGHGMRCTITPNAGCRQAALRCWYTIYVPCCAWRAPGRGRQRTWYCSGDGQAAEAKRGFVFLLRRWVVERSFAWIARCRRLARDYERLPQTLAGLHFAAFVILYCHVLEASP